MVESAELRGQSRSLESVKIPACLKEKGREGDKMWLLWEIPTYGEAVSHKAVHKDFAPAPEFQMTHSDSVLAGSTPDSCLREDPTEQSAQPRLIIHYLSVSKARAGRPNGPVEVAYPLRLPARAPRGSFTPSRWPVSILKSKCPQNADLYSSLPRFITHSTCSISLPG